MSSFSGAPEPPHAGERKEELLDSWKEIAAYLGRTLTTVQRWEKHEGLPIHRQIHQSRGSVYAYRSEIGAWLSRRDSGLQPPGSSSLANSTRKPTSRWVVATTLVLLVGLLWWFVPKVLKTQTKALDFTEPGWVLLTRLDNRTGESVFDGTLEYLLEQELAESSLVGVLSHERIQDSLRLMKKPVESPIDRKLAREICLRAGNIAAIVAGSLDKLRSGYRLQVELVGPVSGAVLATNREEVPSSQQVLPALRSLSYWVRESLGEETGGYQPGEGIGEGLTPSRLRALHLYSKAVENWHSGRPERMLPFLREALKEDPELAVAHIHLAWALRSTVESRRQFSHHLNRAFEFADKSSEEERQWILGSYYDLQGERDKAAEHYEALLALNPNHEFALANLIHHWSRKAYRRDAWIAKVYQYAARRAELRPDNARIQAVGAFWSAYWDNLPQAQKLVDRARELMSAGAEIRADWAAWVELFPAYRQWLEGSPETALREVDRVAQTLESRPEGGISRFGHRVAIAYLTMGRLRAGEQLLNRFSTAKVDIIQQALAGVALVREDEKALRRALHDSFVRPSPVTVILLARLGLLSQAEEAREKALSRYRSSKDSETARRGTIRIMNGALALARGQTAEAIEALEEGIHEVDFRSPLYLGVESLAQIWLEQGKPERARQILEMNSNHREKIQAAFSGYESAPLFWMRLRLQLADVYRQTGREEAAKRVDAELSKLLSHADPDHPFLIALAGGQKDRVGSDQRMSLSGR